MIKVKAYSDTTSNFKNHRNIQIGGRDGEPNTKQQEFKYGPSDSRKATRQP